MKYLLILLIALPMFGNANEGHDENNTLQALAQETCPVMEGNPVDPSLYVDYQGERVYFCCKSCIQAFRDNPEKYIAKLPQFAQKVPSNDGEGHSHAAQPSGSAGFPAYRLVVPLGVLTYTLLVSAALSGLFRRKLKRRFLPLHKIFALLAVSAATLHALIAWFGH